MRRGWEEEEAGGLRSKLTSAGFTSFFKKSKIRVQRGDCDWARMEDSEYIDGIHNHLTRFSSNMDFLNFDLGRDSHH